MQTADILNTGKPVSEQEQAVFWQKNIVPEASRIYIGDEFCDRKLPLLSELEKSLDFCADKKAGLTLVSAFLSDQSSAQFEMSLTAIAKRMERFECVINDWAALEVLKPFQEKCEIVLGRVLVSHYFSDLHNQPLKQENIHCLFPEMFLDLLADYNIRRMEFNSAGHLLHTYRQLDSRGIKAHIYRPYSYVTMSRYCTTARIYSRPLSPEEPCGRECGQYSAELNNQSAGRNILIAGNAYYIKNDDFEKAGLDKARRIISNHNLFYNKGRDGQNSDNS